MAEKKIEGRTVRFDRLPADIGLDMLLRLLQIMSNGDTILESLLTGDEGESEKLAALGLFKFAKTMDRGEVKGFILEMVEHCHVDGSKVVPGIMTLKELFAVFAFAIRTEYSDFFGDGADLDLLKIIKDLRAAAQ